MTKAKREYYIFAGRVGLKKKLVKSGIKMSKIHLLIIRENSKLGKLIKKEAVKKWKKK